MNKRNTKRIFKVGGEKNYKSETNDEELVKLNWLFYIFASSFIIKSSLNFPSAFSQHIIEDLKYTTSKNNPY